MTVSSLTTDFDGHPVVKTTWFDKDDKECSGSYVKDMLTADAGGPVIASPKMIS
jgi:hypothetical protein